MRVVLDELLSVFKKISGKNGKKKKQLLKKKLDKKKIKKNITLTTKKKC